MLADGICARSPTKLGPQQTISSTGWPQMDDVATWTLDAPSPPSAATCSDLVYRVPAEYRWEWRDRRVALAPIELSGPADMPCRSGFPSLSRRRWIDDAQVGATNAKIWLLQKGSLKRVEQVQVEDQIRVKFDRDVPGALGLRDGPLERL